MMTNEAIAAYWQREEAMRRRLEKRKLTPLTGREAVMFNIKAIFAAIAALASVLIVLGVPITSEERLKQWCTDLAHNQVQSVIDVMGQSFVDGFVGTCVERAKKR